MSSQAKLPEIVPVTGQSHRTDPLIIVGNGPVGVHLVNELQRLGNTRNILMFGREESAPYNRVALSSLLQGEVAYESLLTPLTPSGNLVCRLGSEITTIAPEQHRVIDAQGSSFPYSQLVLALGSAPHVPGTPGRDLSGVFTFRDIRDVEHLCSRHARSRHCVVVGGGLLGLEAARGMARYGTLVTLIHHAPFLMNRQLDASAGRQLARSIASRNLTIRTNTAVACIEGNLRVESVRLRNGETLPCDTVVFATGIQPNIELARSTGLSVGRGIRVNDQLQTSREDIFAIGECAEHRGQIYGLVGPGLEQAATLAHNLCNQSLTYTGSILATSLKVTGVPVASVGAVSDFSQGQIDCTVAYQTNTQYRALKLHRGRLVGATGVGHWPGFSGIQALVSRQARIWPWQRRAFRHTGEPGGGQDRQLPDTAILCNCRQISVGRVREELAHTQNPDALCARSGAGQVCGSCRPLVAELACARVTARPVSRLPLVAGAITLIYLLFFLLFPELPVQQSVTDSRIHLLWTDTTARQWSGFTLLGLMTLSMVISLSRRGPKKWGRWFERARNLHIGLALLMAFLLLAHTGLKTGANLNFGLFVIATVLIGLGGITACLVALEPRFPGQRFRFWKQQTARLHLYAAWPIPVVLVFHALSSYYF